MDVYRARWIIEDYFKALKTGCCLERRQIESYDALRKVLAILAPIAWRLLGLTRQDSKRRPTWAFSTLELELLSKADPREGEGNVVADDFVLDAFRGQRGLSIASRSRNASLSSLWARTRAASEAGDAKHVPVCVRAPERRPGGFETACYEYV